MTLGTEERDFLVMIALRLRTAGGVVSCVTPRASRAKSYGFANIGIRVRWPSQTNCDQRVKARASDLYTGGIIFSPAALDAAALNRQPGDVA